MTKTDINDIVLVVDDSPDTLSLINDALEDAGMDVLMALEGRQALKIANKIRPDIILLDAIMPNMDGFETCKALKADPDLQAIPVIFMTGLTDTDHIVQGLESGGVDYLTKPVKPSELLARMKVHLTNARLTNQAQSALDNTGQTLITLNKEGRVQWATPFAYALLAKANATEGKPQTELVQQVLNWLNGNPQPHQEFKPTHFAYPLRIKYLGENSAGETLLKLIDGNKAQGANLLKEHLKLTEREAEVLHWISNGKTNREIGEILNMSPRTVNKHLEQIFPKLGVENRTAAAGIALRILGTA